MMRPYRRLQMRKSILIVLLSALLTLPACAPAGEETARLTVVCTTYPIYLFTSSLAQGVDGVAVERLDTGSTSCLHDYTLSMADMKKLERADIIAVNGAGLEEFLEDALAATDARVIDCSLGVELLENLSHSHEEEDQEGHDHGHWDPHYWMDPGWMNRAAENLLLGLYAADPEYYDEYSLNWDPVTDVLGRTLVSVWGAAGYWEAEIPGLITFHDGFQYFADACGTPLLASIEEEAGSEASAHEIVEITRLVKEYNIPVIFTEVNGSDATAKAISRETGCRVVQLDMLMDGPDDNLENYYTAITGNVTAIINSAYGKEAADFS